VYEWPLMCASCALLSSSVAPLLRRRVSVLPALLLLLSFLVCVCCSTALRSMTLLPLRWIGMLLDCSSLCLFVRADLCVSRASRQSGRRSQSPGSLGRCHSTTRTRTHGSVTIQHWKRGRGGQQSRQQTH
jgi:hypothetical protein